MVSKKQQGFLRSTAALLFGLLLTLVSQLSYSELTTTIGEPAYMTSDNSSVVAQAEALVTAVLLDHNESELSFDRDEVLVGIGESTSVVLALENTGVNDLYNGTIIITLPVEIPSLIVDSSLYSADQQTDGSWLITFFDVISSGQEVNIPITLDIPDDMIEGITPISAVFNANDVEVSDTLAAIRVGKPESGLFLVNQVDKSIVSHDEVIQYTLSLTNRLAVDVPGVVITDNLPVGIRLIDGSVKLGGDSVNDPLVSQDGKILYFNLGNITPNETIQITYMAYVSAAAPTAELASPSIAKGDNATSNNAEATVFVRRDAINNESHIVGRVIDDACGLDPVEQGEHNIRLTSELSGKEITYLIDVSGKGTAIENYELVVNLPKSLAYRTGTALLDGVEINDPSKRGNKLVFTIGELDGEWQHQLSFRAKPDTDQFGVYETLVYAEYEVVGQGEYTSKILSNTYESTKDQKYFKNFTYWPRFKTFETDPRDIDVSYLDDLVKKLKEEVVTRIHVIGHTDNIPIAKRSQSIYKNNQELSVARAESIAGYLAVELRLPVGRVEASGKGASEPIDTNSTTDGRARNRRVELIVETLERDAYREGKIIAGDEAYASSYLYTRDSTVFDGSKGVKDVRLFMEDGRFVDTDEDGRFHFEAVKAGTHVIQLDPESIPEGYEAYLCENNTRFAGTPESQFVDVTKGLVWRSNFHIRPERKSVVTTRLEMRSYVDEKDVLYQVIASGEATENINAELLFDVPKGVDPDLSTIRVNDEFVKAHIEGLSLVVPLANKSETWDSKITIKANVFADKTGDYRAYAKIRVKPENGNVVYSEKVYNVLSVILPGITSKRYDFSTHFISGGTRLTEKDKYTLKDIIRILGKHDIAKIEVLGYTDDSELEGRSSRKEDYEKLSLERAESIASYIRDKLKLSESVVEAYGVGAADAIADNRLPEGRAKNRRVELLVYSVFNEDTDNLKATKPQSIVRRDRMDITHTDPAVEKKENTPIDLPQGFLSIKEGESVATQTIPVRVNLDTRLTVELYVDDKMISNEKIGFRQSNEQSGNTIYTFFGVNIGETGNHKLVLKGIGPFGNARFEQTINVIKTGEVKKIRFLGVDGNVADGESVIEMKLELLDENGITINAPIDLLIADGNLQPYSDEAEDNLPFLEEGDDKVFVDINGIARFNPVNQAGFYRIKLQYNDVEVEPGIYVKPKYRDWIMVGLADGTVGYNNVSGNIESLDENDIDDKYYDEGRLAFYAKGKVLGKYLLTVAFDSSKKNEQDDRLLQLINPEDYYTLYGDTSEQAFDAASKEKLYLRLDGDNFYALFGDFQTDLTVTELSRYSRSLTGAKAVYESEHLSVNAFAAETGQAFIRDELLGDGTSGLYRLSQKNIVANSEKVTIQVRDRFHSERVISEQTMARFVDYHIDFEDGSLYFKSPVSRHDGDFNPVYIVIDYETYASKDDDMVAGARAAVKLADDKIEMGITHIDEGVEGAEANLTGVDMRIDLTDNMQLKAEYATSETTNLADINSGNAYLAEIDIETEQVDAVAYIREHEADFGLGQQNQSENGMKKIGARVESAIAEDMKIDADLAHEENTESKATRDSMVTNFVYSPNTWEYMLGAAIAEDKDEGGVKHSSETLLTGITKKLMDDKLRLHARSEWKINEDAENVDYPQRHRLGMDYALTEKIDMFASHEFASGYAIKSDSTRVGLRARPWVNTSMNSAIENTQGEFDERTFAVFGLTQTVPINERWQASFSYDQTDTIDKKTYTRVNENTTLSSGSSNNVLSSNGAIDEDFWAATAGLGYKSTLYRFDSHLEYRETDTQEKIGVFSSWLRDLSDGVGHALRLEAFITDENDNEDIDTELRYSSVMRPLGEKWFLFNRTELKYQENSITSSGSQTRKFVENLALNYLPIIGWQTAVHLGYKLTKSKLDSDTLTTDTYLLGSETRFDITPKWDVGAHYHVLTTPDMNISKDSYGISVGVDVAKNLWLSIGYNAEGYDDDDFDANGYTAKGLFLKLRYKFDQNTFHLNNQGSSD